MERARVIIRNFGGGEMIVQDRHVRVRLKDTIAAGNDPRSTPG
jgi:hypothetical protein